MAILEEYFCTLDPFEQGSTGASLTLYNRLHSEQLSHTVRYDSPEYKGLGISASLTLPEDSRNLLGNEDKTHYGFAYSLHYENGPLALMTNYSQLADSNHSWVFNIGGGYTFGSSRITAGWQTSQFKDQKPSLLAKDPSFFSAMDQQEWIIGLNQNIGPGDFKLAYSHANISNYPAGKNGSANKYALGYTLNLSKRTAIYSVFSYTDSDNKEVGSVYNNNGAARESVTGVQIGIMHHF